MGDMKTPDFDDLLAAFDIPDIEAIQSDTATQRDEGSGALEVKGGAASFSRCAESQSEQPVVSVIVKNTGRSESVEEQEPSDKPSSIALAHQEPVKLEDFTSEIGPRGPASAAVELQFANGIEETQPSSQLENQTKSRSCSESSSFRSTPSDTDSETAAEPGNAQDAKDILTSLTPILYSKSSPHPVQSGPTHFSPHKAQSDNPLLSSVPKKDGLKTVHPAVEDPDEDDSEPDLGGPLVIHESPTSEMSSLPRLKQRNHNNLDSNPQSPKLSGPFKSEAQHEMEEEPHKQSSPPQLRSCQAPSSAAVQQEKYPDHVIHERDSPESPPPSETGFLSTNRNRSPDVGSMALNPGEILDGESSKEAHSAEPEEMNEEVTGEEEKPNVENSTAGTADTESVSSPLRSLRVKIKMPTGSVTRTVTNVAPKRGAKAPAKDVDASKASLENHKATKTKKEMAQEKEMVETKPKVSLTAMSITKTAALPSVSSPRSATCAVNLRSLGQKTLTSGTPPATHAAPQSGSRPASIVNSTGAIISRSQTSLVEAFNKILNNKNLLPSYKPDLSAAIPAEWGISVPAQGYRCFECGDSFTLEQSLVQHYDRRSLRIEVTCNHCAKRLVFFNKCSLLLHAREHKERGLIMQCSHLVMRPVPVEQMICQQESAAEGQATSKHTAQTLHVAPPKREEALQHTGNTCPECQAQFGSKEKLYDHFQEVKTANSTLCSQCSPPMLLPNSCSAAAHQRVHQGCPPHVCPECGGTGKQPLFDKHLLESCLHFSRRVGYRCSSCLVVFGGLNSVKAHIQQAHCDVFHKCPSCPMAFKSAPSTQSHIASQHPSLTDGQAMVIYKCVMCDTVYTHKLLLHTHFDTHLANQKVHVFKCPQCNKLFSQRSYLLEHFKLHKSIKEEVSSPPDGSNPNKQDSSEEDWTEKERVKMEVMKTPSVWKCRSCSTQHVEREDYITHMSREHGKILKKFPCNKCESSFTTTSSMRRHIRDKHKVMSRSFRCQFCSESKKTFSSRAMLEKHLQLRHGMGQDTMTREEEADSSSEQDKSSVSRLRRRAAVKTEQDAESTESASPVKRLRSSARPLYTQPESGFSCAPCGFTSEDKATFLEHIGKHRRGGSEGGEVQCLQCGACFTSMSSLSRHRFITHKVRDAPSNGTAAPSRQPLAASGNATNHSEGFLNCSDPASPSAQPPACQEEGGALSCRVCGQHFEKATDLNTHFRTHGMAFIIARNAGKLT